MTRSLPARVDIREVGPRDGLQIEEPLATADKLRLIEAIAATGVRRVEATAFVSPRAVPSMADAAEIAAELYRWPEIQWSALAVNLTGARRAVAAGIADVEYVISAGDLHSRANSGKSTAEATAAVAEVAEVVHAAGGVCEVIIATAWDCPFGGRTDPARVAEIAATAAALGADRLCLADTIGTAGPVRVGALIERVRAAVPGVELAAHFHNTRGSGLANAFAAVQAGVVQLDSSIGGLGGCPFAPGASGNIATEELVYLLEDGGIDTGLALERVLDAAELAQSLIGRRLDSSLLRAARP